MKKTIVWIVISVLLIVAIGGYAVWALLLPDTKKDKGSEETATAALAASATKADQKAESKEESKKALAKARKAREKQWEKDMTVEITDFDIDAIEALNLLNKWELGYDKDDDGYALVPFSFASMPTEREARCSSAKEKGLTTHKISDAPDYAYDTLSAADIERIVKAKYGETITVDNLKGLSKEFRRKLLENPVLFEGFVNLTKDLHYEDSKSIRELNSWVDEFLKKYKKYRKKSERRGINRWLKAVGSKDNPKPFMTDEYLEYAVWYISLFDGCEVNVEKLTSTANYHLVGGDRASCTKLTPATNQESEAALTFTYYFKDGTIGPKVASNLLDSRPEIVEWRPPAKPSGITPTGSPTPKHEKVSTPAPKVTKKPQQPTPGNGSLTPTPTPTPSKKSSDPTPSKTTPKSDPDPTSGKTTPKKDPDPTSGKTKKDPDPTPGQKTTPQKDPDPDPVPNKAKDETERPEAREKDDKGPGEFEPTPKVPKSTSEEVSESQHQPQAKEQGGGTSTSQEDLTPVGTVTNPDGSTTTTEHRQSEGGQTVVDQTTTNPDGSKEFTENAQATTEPIGDDSGYTTPAPDDAQNGTAEQNGEFVMD